MSENILYFCAGDFIKNLLFAIENIQERSQAFYYKITEKVVRLPIIMKRRTYDPHSTYVKGKSTTCIC